MDQRTIVQQKNKIKRLEERLNDGWTLIEQKRSAGHDISGLEDFFVQLLGEYEEACDELSGRQDRRVAA